MFKPEELQKIINPAHPIKRWGDHDLNSVHEIEKELIFSKRQAFFKALQKVCSEGLADGQLVHISECILADADQHKEALRMIGVELDQ